MVSGICRQEEVWVCESIPSEPGYEWRKGEEKRQRPGNGQTEGDKSATKLESSGLSKRGKKQV